MDVSPHLKIRTPLAEITPRAMRQARDNLEALYEFAADSAGNADLLSDDRSPESIRLFGAGIHGASTTGLKLFRQFYRQRKRIGPTLSDRFQLPAFADETSRIRPTPKGRGLDQSLDQSLDQMPTEVLNRCERSLWETGPSDHVPAPHPGRG